MLLLYTYLPTYMIIVKGVPNPLHPHGAVFHPLNLPTVAWSCTLVFVVSSTVFFLLTAVFIIGPGSLQYQVYTGGSDKKIYLYIKYKSKYMED